MAAVGNLSLTLLRQSLSTVLRRGNNCTTVLVRYGPMDSRVQPSPTQRLEHAEAWLKQARRDRMTVERILGRPTLRKSQHLAPSPETAVYLLQQAVEKAAKSLMFAAGEDEDTLRKEYSHNSLLVILDFIRQRFTDESYRKMFNSLLNYRPLGVGNADEAIRATEDLIHKAKSGTLRELAVLSPDAMSVKVGLMLNLHNQTTTVTNRLLRAKTSVTVDPSTAADSSATDYIMDVETAAIRRNQLAPDMEEAVRGLVDPVALGWNETWRRTERSRMSIIRDRVLSEVILPQSWTLPALYMLAALTFPHAVSCRYPAPWDAPTDAIEAARRGKLGTQHYTDSLGIVAQLPALHQLTRLVLDSMGPLLSRTVESSDHCQV